MKHTVLLIFGKAGAYKYAQSEDFEILLFAYSFDNEDVKVIDFAQGEQLSEEIITALSDPRGYQNCI